MVQWYRMKVELTNNGLSNSVVKTQLGDSASVDAFSRLRVSQQQNVFDNQFTYDIAPLLFEQIVSGTGATATHDSTNRCALLSFSSTSVTGKSYLQSYDYFRYQPSKSQLVFITFNMIETTLDVLKFAGYSDGSNGIQFELDGSTKQFSILSGTSLGTQTITQSNWNLDTLDGTASANNPSGLLLDITKVQILILDFQALYAGRVRIGFDIGGSIIYCHEFNHSNLVLYPYLQTANLPIRCGMSVQSRASTPVTTSMRFLCCSVATEGGQDETIGYAFTTEATDTPADGVFSHLLSIQPKLTFNSITNRSKIIMTSFNIINIGNHAVTYKLCIGQALTGISTADVNTTYSAVQTATGTLSGTPAIVIEQGYIESNNKGSQIILASIFDRYPITLNSSGAVRDLGRLTLLVAGSGGASSVRGSFNWIEIR